PGDSSPGRRPRRHGSHPGAASGYADTRDDAAGPPSESRQSLLLMAGTLTRRNFLSFDFGDRSRDPDHWVRIHRNAMACRFEVMLSSDDASDMAAARSALDEADDLEGMLTIFRDASAVSDVNRRAAVEE